MARLQPTTLEVSNRFPSCSFVVQVPKERFFEVACATDPRLFHSDNLGKRTPENFHTSRERGLLRAPGGQATYLLPSDVTGRFAGADRIYYALGTYGNVRGDGASFSLSPETLDSAPFVRISPQFKGVQSRLGSRSDKGRARRYGSRGDAMAWGGDHALQQIRTREQHRGVEYDDGFDPSLWQRGSSAVDAAPAVFGRPTGEDLPGYEDAPDMRRAGTTTAPAGGSTMAPHMTTAMPNGGGSTTGAPLTTTTTTAPGAGVPTTGVPTTGVPTTGVPTTGVPTTGVPTTGVPTTGVPTTGAPTTGVAAPPMTTTGRVHVPTTDELDGEPYGSRARARVAAGPYGTGSASVIGTIAPTSTLPTTGLPPTTEFPGLPTTGVPFPPTTGLPVPPTTGAPLPPTTGAPVPPTTGTPLPPTTGLPTTGLPLTTPPPQPLMDSFPPHGVPGHAPGQPAQLPEPEGYEDVPQLRGRAMSAPAVAAQPAYFGSPGPYGAPHADPNRYPALPPPTAGGTAVAHRYGGAQQVTATPAVGPTTTPGLPPPTTVAPPVTTSTPMPGAPTVVEDGLSAPSIEDKFSRVVLPIAERETGMPPADVSDEGRRLRGYGSRVDNARGEGLEWGILHFKQARGDLGKVLEVCKRRNPERFAAIFGASGDELLQVTRGSTAEERMAPVAGHLLWSEAWNAAFEAAAGVPEFQAAQNEVAVERYVDPLLEVARSLGLTTDRGLAMLCDRCVVLGIDQGQRWVSEALAGMSSAPLEQKLDRLVEAAGSDPRASERLAQLRRDGRSLHDTQLLG